jgi:diacylglycerol kinase family enzyme
MRVIFKLFRGKIDQSRYVLTLKANEALITRKKGKYLNLDGEPIRFEKEIHLKVNAASLQIIVPKV